jgi:hypothetical protein
MGRKKKKKINWAKQEAAAQKISDRNKMRIESSLTSRGTPSQKANDYRLRPNKNKGALQ